MQADEILSPFHYSLHKRQPPLSRSHSLLSRTFSLPSSLPISHFNLIVCALLLSVWLARVWRAKLKSAPMWR